MLVSFGDLVAVRISDGLRRGLEARQELHADGRHDCGAPREAAGLARVRVMRLGRELASVDVTGGALLFAGGMIE